MNSIGNLIADKIPEPPPLTQQSSVTPEQLQYMINMAETQVAVATWLALGMLLVFVAILLFALNWKKSAFCVTAVYAVSLIMMPVSFTAVLGPLTLGAALLGLILEIIRKPVRLAKT